MSLLQTLHELREFDTALLANTMEFIQAASPHEYYMGRSIQSVTPTLGPTVGVAVTCEMDSSTPEGRHVLEAYWRQLEEIHEIELPVVWVVKTVGSRPQHECVLGDGMAKILYAAGCIGVVTDGGVRDVNGLLSTPFAAYCGGKTVHHCALRIRSVSRPVEIGGITVSPGDVIHANAEGVIKIPKGCLATLAARARQMRAFEHELHCAWRRTDSEIKEKARRMNELLVQYGFATSTSVDDSDRMP
jgi:4-hydroxy-4-methyl-2-oxoglutarate aldolase